MEQTGIKCFNIYNVLGSPAGIGEGNLIPSGTGKFFSGNDFSGFFLFTG